MCVDRPHWIPAEVDIDTPSVARVYDYLLGGSHNFAADRAFADRMVAAAPATAWAVRENRAFLGRAVRYLAGQGVRQFVDIGSGIPTVGNVHEVAAEVIAGPRVAYVDNDPVAVAHSRAILAGNPCCAVVGADMLDSTPVLHRPEVRELIDLTQPVGVLLAAVLHFVTDDDVAQGLVDQLVADLAPGSFIAISHATAEQSGEEAGEVQDMYTKAVANLALRSHAQVTRLFDKLTLVEPGVVQIPRWRPDPGTEIPETPYPGYAGIGRVS